LHFRPSHTPPQKVMATETLVSSCCGLDVHSRFVTACVLSGPSQKPKKVIRSFSSTAAGLLELRDWLLDLGCRAVAMESTGVYWKPVWHLLEGPEFDLVLANAYAVKAVKGRKTDVGDAEWIAKLHRSGLVPASFVPPQPIRDLRDLTRYRTALKQEAARERNRIQKLLEDANIKISEVISDLFGKSGRAMLAALIATEGLPDAERVADMAQGRLRKKIPDLVEALAGNVRDHHRYMLSLGLQRLSELERHVADIEARIDASLAPYTAEMELLETIPGVAHHVAAVIIAEAGADMSVFPDAPHFASWAGLTPGTNQSGGKMRPAHLRPGNRHLRAALVESAWAASRTRNTFLSATFWRLAARIGRKKALIAIAHKQANAVHTILSGKVPYAALDAAYRRSMDEARYQKRLIAKVEALGFRVTRRDAEQTEVVAG
jgi:transposase